VLSSQFSVLSSQFSVFSFQFSVLILLLILFVLFVLFVVQNLPLFLRIFCNGFDSRRKRNQRSLKTTVFQVLMTRFYAEEFSRASLIA
ncbi:MAG: hypothetical protein DWI02_07705, partial [Planctomycetota bacterium]